MLSAFRLLALAGHSGTPDSDPLQYGIVDHRSRNVRHGLRSDDKGVARNVCTPPLISPCPGTPRYAGRIDGGPERRSNARERDESTQGTAGARFPILRFSVAPANCALERSAFIAAVFGCSRNPIADGVLSPAAPYTVRLYFSPPDSLISPHARQPRGL